MGLDYEKAGVVGLGKDKDAKHFALVSETYSFSRKIIETPFGKLYYVADGLLQGSLGLGQEQSHAGPFSLPPCKAFFQAAPHQ